MRMTAAMAQASPAELIYMSDAVKMEIRKQQARRRAADAAEFERARMVEYSRDRLLARDLQMRRDQAAKRPGFFRRKLEELENAWAVTWAVLMLTGEIFILWGEAAGLWVVERE